MLRAMPVLQVRDVVRSRDFYCGKLGFSSHGIWGDNLFCIVQNGPVTIAFQKSYTDGPLPLNQYWAAYIYVPDADALHARWKAAGVPITRAPEDMPYGLREYDVTDPDGHVIAFGYDPERPGRDPGLLSWPGENG